MMGDVIEANIVTSLPIPVERILAKASDADLEMVVVIGWDKEGEPYFASSVSGGPEVLWLLELTKNRLFKITSDDA